MVSIAEKETGSVHQIMVGEEQEWYDWPVLNSINFVSLWWLIMYGLCGMSVLLTPYLFVVLPLYGLLASGGVDPEFLMLLVGDIPNLTRSFLTEEEDE